MFDEIVDTIAKCKKTNRRCNLHSLEVNHKQKLIYDWLNVWDLFKTDDSRLKSIIIDCCQLQQTLESYIRKHRFCVDCKLKVLKAFNILVGELDSKKEKGYRSALYEGLECCTITNNSVNGKHKFHSNVKHLHLKNDKLFIAGLIDKAESEIIGR